MSKGKKPQYEVKIWVTQGDKNFYRRVGAGWDTKSGNISVTFDEPGPYKGVLIIPI